MSVPRPRAWIAWEVQRRSLGLAQRLGADLRLFLHEGLGRYPRCLFGTAALLAGRRGGVVIVQNPSMVLAACAGLLKRLCGYALVVDRHSNFPHLAPAGALRGAAGLKRRISGLMSAYTLRRADLTLVTNPELADHVRREGGRAFVLPDPFPDLSAWLPEAAAAAAEGETGTVRRGPREILFVSSWAFDEPIDEAIEVCRRMKGEIVIRITGKIPARFAYALRRAPENFRPTGFLSEDAYFAAMARCDAVMAVTRRESTLVCGGYEGAAMGKPLILGDSRALRGYFDAGCVYTDGSADDLEARIRDLLSDLPARRAEIRAWRERREAEWRRRLAGLEDALGILH